MRFLNWEARRRLSFALAIRAETPTTLPGFCRVLKQVFHWLWITVTALCHEQIIGLTLLVAALLSTGGVWVTQVVASSPASQHITSAANDASAIRIALVHPALNASMISAASPY
jgi:hypothetical protein